MDKLGTMKNLFLTAATLLVALLSFISCENGNDNDEDEYWIVDWSPVTLLINVQDVAGSNLLDPDNPANIIDGTSITFQGKTYEACRDWYDSQMPFSMPETKAYLSTLYGLYLYQSNWSLPECTDTVFSLYFGEIDGADDMDEDLVITWPDKTTDIIHYHCSDHKNNKSASCNRYYKLNGKKQDSSTFTITK